MTAPSAPPNGEKGTLETWLERIGRLSCMASGLVVATMMVLMTIDTFGRRYGFPVHGGHDASEALMAAVVYLPLMFVQFQGGHIAVNILTGRLPIRAKITLDALGVLIGAVTFSTFAYLSAGRTLRAYEMGDVRGGTVDLITWPFRFLMTIGLTLFALQLVVSLVQRVRLFVRPPTSYEDFESMSASA